MLKSVKFDGFKGVPHLENTKLYQQHGGCFTFATDRATAIVGPNGVGKSALMQALALRFLAWYTSESALDNHYVMEREHHALWASKGWRHENQYEFAPGMVCDTDNAPALFYRPGHIPGNEESVSHAFVTGYSKEATAYDALVKDKSTGEQGQALLAHIENVLEGKVAGPIKYLRKNWRFGAELLDKSRRRDMYDWEHWAEILKTMFLGVSGGVPLILMVEPERSLDARAEMRLWTKVAGADFSRMQVVVETHSLYPLLHRDQFNIIEAVPGYVDEVLALMRL